jgi:hypothetical protein
MTSAYQSSAPIERCATYDGESGRCQLFAGHEGPHATDIGGSTYMTWQSGRTQYWPLYPAPHWLIDLPWVPGYQPPVHEIKQSALI